MVRAPPRDAVRARPGVRLPPILQGRPDPRLRRNMEAYAERHDVRGLMAELTQSIMVGMPEDPRRFLAAEMGRQLQQQTDDRNDLGAMPRDSFVLRLHASTGHGREGAGGRVLRWQGVLSSAPSGRMVRYQAERELTEQLRAVIWGGSAGGGEHHELHAEPQAEPPAVPDQAPPAILAERNRIRRGGKATVAVLQALLSENPTAAFARADIDGSGDLTFDEWHLACGGEEGVEADVLRALFDEFDADQNGCVSLAEFQAGLKTVRPLATGFDEMTVLVRGIGLEDLFASHLALMLQERRPAGEK